MPDELQEARINFATFAEAQKLVSKYHRIGFPLRFWQNTKHDIDTAAVDRLIEDVCKSKAPKVRPHPVHFNSTCFQLHLCLSTGVQQFV
jgi:hypothetical protein